MGDGVEKPTSAGPYIFSAILKISIIAFCIIIAAFRTELFMARVSFPATGDRDLPLAICEYFDTDEDPKYYGDRVCNNGIAGAIMSILFAMAFMTAELQAACATSKSVKPLHFVAFVFAVALSIYWLISAALLANLYTRYCDNLSRHCRDTEEKFLLLPIMGFLTMAAWIGQAILSLVRTTRGK
ncbi:uncharacterized protein [Dysidea avara]|uniref:uncharacterized protein n=1 Tax=Dysidea avara TaxID=196820 RepID=UPI003319BCBA